MSAEPEELLAALDDQQRVVAEALHGPVCVLAGAGTGKTRAITHRIAYGVASGAYAPNRVMALTFTSRAAAELRSRLRVLGAPGVPVRTFHAAALSQLGYFWPLLVGGSAPELLAGKARLLGQAAERLRLAVDTATLRDLAAEIEWRKVSGHSIEQYAAGIGGRTPPGRLDLDQTVALQRAYEELKDERRRIDFEDVLLACAGMIESEPRMAMQVREQYRFFVVDEYQDVSPLQQRLLELWLGGRRDLCVVGDASQTIYSFAGARSDYLLGFEHRHEGATLVRLEQNYRSRTPIVSLANELMRGRPGALRLHALRDGEGAVPSARPFPDDGREAEAVAARIREQLDAGAAPESIAVLYRVGAQSLVLERALAASGVPHRVHGATRFFDRPEVRQAVMELRAASVAVRGEPLFQSVSDVLRSLGWTQEPPEAAGAVRERWESLDALMGLADAAAPGTGFREFTDELLERQAAHHEPTLAAVTLATLHSAKGLEWDHVHIVGLSEGLVPIAYATTLEERDEERRLLYVGITRARESLGLSWSERGERGGRRSPSRFLEELRSRTPDAAAAAAR